MPTDYLVFICVGFLFNSIINETIGESARLPTLGVPFNDDLSSKGIALSSSLKTPPIMNLTYNEGGNALTGLRNGQPYVIIGLDSYAASKFLMEKDLGRKMTDEEIRMAFAIDYGVSKEHVYFVEQLGDFHLDMSMTIVGKNTILLNDAEQAQKMFESEQNQWLEDRKKKTSMNQ